MRVLIVKTSSLGDIIHTLPAVSDAASIYPDIEFDWVVEEPFKEIPAWHPSVKRVIPVSLRRWRTQKWRALQSGEFQTFLKNLRQEKYDCIIDAQGLLKSVCLTFLARGKLRAGLSFKSARESVVSVFYQKRAKVPWGQHAILRARKLFAHALDYAMPEGEINFGIDNNRLPPVESSDPYYVFLHGTTWETKHWPEKYWIELAKIAAKSQCRIQLLWGNEAEFNRAHRIAAAVPQVFVIPTKLRLGEVARVLAQAEGIVTVDTGLGHLASALEVPTVSLYGPTDPKENGTLGNRQISLAAEFPCAPCFGRICTYKPTVSKDQQLQQSNGINPPCFSSFPPTKVWEQLMLLKRT